MGQGRKVALLVGVGEYGSGLKSLQCPANGVAELQAVLEATKIGGFDEVIPLVNPDVGTMRTRMAEVFNRLKKPDLVLFYFTGHGIKTMTGEFYLTTSQTQLFENSQLNQGTAVEASFVKSVIGNCYAQRKVIILDCCFGAAFAEGFLTMDSGGVDVEAQLGGEGWVVLTAATARNYALEQEGEPLSVYTRYLVEGLKTGAAAREGQDYISVGHLHDYVRGKVQTAAPTMEPAIFNGYQGEAILLARTVINPETTYRQKVQIKIRRGRIAPAGKRFLDTWRQKLSILPERAAAIETEVLQPYVEKQRHLDEYAETLRDEIAEEFPLSPEAIQDLKDLQRLWNLRDEDVEPVMQEILLEQGAEHEGLLVTMLNPENTAQVSATLPFPKSIVPVASSELLTYSPFATVWLNKQGQVFERLTQQAQYFVEDLGDGVTLEMVRIPAGEFTMGSAEGEEGARDNEKPQHRVEVPAFFMGKFPVTQAQYEAITGQNPSKSKGGQHPVEQVSWQDAVAFCQALSERVRRTYRLPSEAEWEYACRAGMETPFYFGPPIRTDLANYDGKKTYGEGPKGIHRNKTTEVGLFPPNSFGLYDLHANVWEWCQDIWHESYIKAPTNGIAWVDGEKDKYTKVMRGGSWNNGPQACRSGFRFRAPHVYCNDVLCFRVVCASR